MPWVWNRISDYYKSRTNRNPPHFFISRFYFCPFLFCCAYAVFSQLLSFPLEQVHLHYKAKIILSNTASLPKIWNGESRDRYFQSHHDASCGRIAEILDLALRSLKNSREEFLYLKRKVLTLTAGRMFKMTRDRFQEEILLSPVCTFNHFKFSETSLILATSKYDCHLNFRHLLNSCSYQSIWVKVRLGLGLEPSGLYLLRCGENRHSVSFTPPVSLIPPRTGIYCEIT